MYLAQPRKPDRLIELFMSRRAESFKDSVMRELQLSASAGYIPCRLIGLLAEIHGCASRASHGSTWKTLTHLKVGEPR